MTASRRCGHPNFDGLEMTRRPAAQRQPNRDGDASSPTTRARHACFDGRSGEPVPDRWAPPTCSSSTTWSTTNHARSTGPYSMITQQPLGGKASSAASASADGEVWALETGAAYALQELADPTTPPAESRCTKAIVRARTSSQSLRVLIRECSLCLDVEALDAAGIDCT